MSAVRAIVGLNIACFLAMVCGSSLKSLLIPSSLTLLNWGASSASETIAAGQFWRLATSCFVHAGLLHLAINMFVLRDIGRECETAFGSFRFCIIYFFSAIGGAITSIFINPLLVSAGASGAIFGTFGAMLAIVWRRPANFEKGYLLLHGKIVLALILYSIIFSFIDKNTDNAAHFGGLILGFIAGLCTLPPKENSKPALQLAAPILLLLALSGAYTVAHEILAARPDVLAEIDYRKAVQLLNDKKYGEALPLLDATLAKSPDNANAYCDRARAYLELKDFDKAIADCNIALEKDPKSGKETYAIRAAVFQKKSDYTSAVADLTKLVELMPNDAMAFNNRAWSEEAEGELEQALKDCNESIRLKRDSATTYDTRAVAYILLKRFSDAKQDLAIAIKLKPTDGAFYYHRMIAKKLSGEPFDDDKKMFESNSYTPESWEPK